MPSSDRLSETIDKQPTKSDRRASGMGTKSIMEERDSATIAKCACSFDSRFDCYYHGNDPPVVNTGNDKLDVIELKTPRCICSSQFALLAAILTSGDYRQVSVKVVTYF